MDKLKERFQKKLWHSIKDTQYYRLKDHLIVFFPIKLGCCIYEHFSSIFKGGVKAIPSTAAAVKKLSANNEGLMYVHILGNT